MVKQVDLRVKLILLALLNTAILSAGHAFISMPLIGLSFFAFILMVLFSPKKFFLPLMLFYLPWSPIMKLSPDSYTMFTIVLPLYFLYTLVAAKGKEGLLFSHANVILTALMAILLLSVKLINGSPIDPDALLFLLMMLFVPSYMSKYHPSISFVTCSSFLSLGTISACIASKVLVAYPHMLAYIVVETWEQMGLVRLSGFYGDSNFYSIHILISIACLLILVFQQRGFPLALSMAGIILLIYFGTESVSKMFLLTLLAILIIWLTSLFSLRQGLGKKIAVLTGITTLILLVLTSGIFAEQIDDYMFRFSLASDASSLTTGRSDIWANYFNYFISNPAVFFFGAGYTTTFPDFNAASHSTIIQMFYQLGLAGIVLIFFWLWEFIRAVWPHGGSQSLTQRLLIFHLGLACFLPWLALDMLFFDEFYYTIALFFIGSEYITSHLQPK